MEEYADIESGMEYYEDSENYEITPTPTPIYEENIDSSYESETGEEYSSSGEINNKENNEGDPAEPEEPAEEIEEGVEEGEESEELEIPDNEVLNDEIVQDLQNDNSNASGSSFDQSAIIDYSVQLAQINEYLEDLQTDKTLNDIYNQLEDIETLIEVQNDNIVKLSNNISFAFRLETGVLVAVWASIIAYIAFSKIR